MLIFFWFDRITCINVKNAVTWRRRRQADIIKASGHCWLVRIMAVAHIVKSTQSTICHVNDCFAKATDDSAHPPPLTLVMCAGQDEKHASQGVSFFFLSARSETQLQPSAFLCHVRRHHLISWLTTGVDIRCRRLSWDSDGTFPSLSSRAVVTLLPGGRNFGVVMTSSLPRLSLQRWRSHKGGGRGGWVPALWLLERPLTDKNRTEWCWMK